MAIPFMADSYGALQQQIATDHARRNQGVDAAFAQALQQRQLQMERQQREREFAFRQAQAAIANQQNQGWLDYQRGVATTKQTALPARVIEQNITDAMTHASTTGAVGSPEEAARAYPGLPPEMYPAIAQASLRARPAIAAEYQASTGAATAKNRVADAKRMIPSYQAGADDAGSWYGASGNAHWYNPASWGNAESGYNPYSWLNMAIAKYQDPQGQYPDARTMDRQRLMQLKAQTAPGSPDMLAAGQVDADPYLKTLVQPDPMSGGFRPTATRPVFMPQPTNAPAVPYVMRGRPMMGTNMPPQMATNMPPMGPMTGTNAPINPVEALRAAAVDAIQRGANPEAVSNRFFKMTRQPLQ